MSLMSFVIMFAVSLMPKLTLYRCIMVSTLQCKPCLSLHRFVLCERVEHVLYLKYRSPFSHNISFSPHSRVDVTALVVGPDVFATPASMRKMLSSKPYKATVQDLPSCCCGDGKTAQITNWATFGGDVKLEGCELRLHIPVLNSANILWDNAVPFAAGNGRKGIICWTLNASEDGIQKGMPVGEVVDRTLFP